MYECKACVAPEIASDVGMAECRYCPAGFAYEDSTNCKACGPGEYSERPYHKSCIRCPTGRMADGEGDCVPCPQGHISSADGTNCTACGVGKYVFIDNTGLAATCKQCPNGKMADGEGDCALCPQGKISSSDRTKCKACSAGKYANNVAGMNIGCITCPLGKVSGGTWCVECPAGSRTSTDRSKCKEHGTYIQIGGPISEFHDARQTSTGDNVLWVAPKWPSLGSYKYASEDDAIDACDANVACVGYKYKGYGDKPYVLCKQFQNAVSTQVAWKHPSVCRHSTRDTACDQRHPNGTFVEPHCAKYSYQCPEANWWACA